ncbi:hypothetical protein TWF730_004524 [Orbilia blumenaviensis]|uniref:Uncharacterized protein n=1 Tax=Orbilia blumenaviensis TaxID=1796055 RepID=A0AAV9TY35_9PEZI
MTVAASPPSLTTLLSTLTTSLTSTANSLPSAPTTSQSSGLSLLDLKNDVFLSYLHHLSYLLLFRIRNRSLGVPSTTDKDGDAVVAGDTTGAEELLSTLATLRLWLEKGVKPCENKLKYQIEKVLKAASEWEREKVRLEKAKEEAENDEDDEDDDEDGSSGSDGGSDEEIDSDEEITSESDTDLPKTLNYDSDDLSSKPHSKSKSIPATATLKNALSYRPNPSSLAKPASASLPSKGMDSSAKDGVYRPPKLNPVVMPSAPSTTEMNDPDAKKRGGEGRKQKARVIDEYLASMPGAAPVAEPSIGSNVGRLGRTKTAREREEERERRDYEESNFVRLPGLTKKEKREKGRREAGRGKEWGGEDWGSIEKGMGLDRIERLTKRKDGGGMLARSRKRGADIEGEARIGERFEKRRKVVDRERRRRG